MSDKSIAIVIDGQEIAARPGQTVIEAADEAGIYIPRLCHHPALPPGGHCRVCTVKINGRPASSCTFPVSEGLVIENSTDELRKLRASIVEMLFVEGNHYCPTCEASGECELQATAYRLGMIGPMLPDVSEARELDASHKDVYLDRDRCILCGRCVRASMVKDGKHVFGYEGRGIKMRVGVDTDHGLGGTDLSKDDAASRICPTGALTVKREGYNTPIGEREYDHTPIGSEIEAMHGAAAVVEKE